MERIDKEHKEKIMEIITKGGSDEYETSYDENGIPKSKLKANVEKGKRNRTSGANFELKVRTDLERKGWVVNKFGNNVDLEKNKMILAKKKYNPFLKFMTIGTGFPDFISIKNVSGEIYHVEGVEVKTNGILSKEEKQKCKFYLQNKVFSKIWIAKKGKKRGEIEYIDFAEKYK